METLVVVLIGVVIIVVVNVVVVLEVAVLAEGYMSANTYSLTWDAKDVPSGLYMVRAESAGYMATEKLMLLK